MMGHSAGSEAARSERDAVIRVPRWSWALAKKYAAKAGRELREVSGAALDEYVKSQEGK